MASATALVRTQIILVVIIDRIRGKITPTAVLGGMSLAVVGVLIITGVDFNLSSRALAGDLLAIARRAVRGALPGGG